VRPGGLTALAAFNLIGGSIVGFGGLAALAMNGSRASTAGLALIVLGIVDGVLLVASAVGYLQRKRVLGFILGNAYAIVALFSTCLHIAVSPNDFTILGLWNFIYPLITLFLVNIVFREDLVL
jgi:hypothetical protein